MEILINIIKLITQIFEADLPKLYLYSLLSLPFLLLVSEIVIRQVIKRPFTHKAEIFYTLGYLTIGVVIFLTSFKLIIGTLVDSSYFSISWTTAETIFIGQLILILFALLSPITSIYVHIKAKILQIIYLIGSSILFSYVIGRISLYMYTNLHIPVYIYLGMGLFYLIFVVLVTKVSSPSKKI